MKSITKTEIDTRMFNSVAMVQIGKHTYSAVFYAVKISETEIIPVIITSKSILNDDIQVLLTYINPEGNISLGSMSVPKDMWYISENYDIGIWPCANFMTAIQASGNKLTNVPLVEQLVISSEDLNHIDLIEKTFSIGYIGSVRNDTNNWPLSYVAYTASPVGQDFDKKPYFLLNGDEPGPGHMLGSPVFINVAYNGKFGVRFVGMWVNQEVKMDMVGPNKFSAILKSEKIIEFVNETINKMEQKEDTK